MAREYHSWKIFIHTDSDSLCIYSWNIIGLEWCSVPHLGWARIGILDGFRVLPLLSFRWILCWLAFISSDTPDSKVHGANMGPIWGRQDPGGPLVGPMNFAIWNRTGYAVDHRHHVDLLTCIEHKGWYILKGCANACWVYSVKSVSKIQLLRLPSIFSLQ